MDSMDRKIEKKTWTFKRLATYTGIAALVFFVFYQLFFADRRSKLRVDREKITISEVHRGVYQDFIPQTGIVYPSRTVYLDAIEGGTIEEIVAKSGSLVKKGDEILKLRNLNRELTVLQQEASFNESINRVRETRLQIAQNDLRQKETLASIDNQLATLGPQYKRMSELFEKKLISKQDYEKVEADYEYNLKRRQFTYEAYRIDSLDRARQLSQSYESEDRMLKNLEGIGQILENLVIRAPIDGQLTRPELEVGQAINVGENLGQIDVVGSYKVQVPIDELYLPRIFRGLNATTTFANREYKLVITYVYQSVQNGRFNVDMDFAGETPEGIRRGQSLRLYIELGKSSEELLLPVGGFYKDTGGNWAYVLTSDGDRAIRRDIKLGRKNTENFEVLEGLQPGEHVITSSYENFGDNEVLLLN